MEENDGVGMNEKLIDITERSLVLLCELLEDSSKVQRKGDQPRAAFIHRHARNVLSLGEDVAFLLQSERADSCPIIVRSVLESTFKIGAAAGRDDAAISILASEIEDEIKRIGILMAGTLGPHPYLVETSDSLKKYLAEIRNKYSLVPNADWSVYRCAELAGFSDIYRIDYYLLSKHTHANISGLMQQEAGIDSENILKTVTFAALAATGRSAPLLGVCHPQRYIDDSAKLLDESVKVFLGAE